jgi:two-component system, chemotaxis family, chemotaxis protein CheY
MAGLAGRRPPHPRLLKPFVNDVAKLRAAESVILSLRKAADALFGGHMQINIPKDLEARLPALKVLVVDDDHYMRKVVRAMLIAIGVRYIHEASQGAQGLDAIRELNPDIVIVDWEMPLVDGLQFIRTVRSPGRFPMPDVPIILLTGHADRWRVIEAARFGVHEYLLKPVSTKALMDRIAAILVKPRKMVRLDGYYGPLPRKLVVLSDDDEREEAGRRLAPERVATALSRFRALLVWAAVSENRIPLSGIFL